jgi:2-C-methyl-D-erythritol 4-phosphate cytidylyltransferase
VRAGADGAVPGVPVADTIKRVDPSTGLVLETLDRPALRAVQTPQAFAAAVLRRAHAGQADATDDAALVEAVGGQVVVVEGDPANLKITGPDDLVRAEALLTRRNPGGDGGCPPDNGGGSRL